MSRDSDDHANNLHHFTYDNQDRLLPHITPGHIPPPPGVEPRRPDRSEEEAKEYSGALCSWADLQLKSEGNL